MGANMENKQKLKLIRALIREIKEDWGANCKKKDLTWNCWSCLAGLVIQFLEEWDRSLYGD